MFIANDKIAFVELPKTGTTHIDALLAAVLEGRQVGKHNRPERGMFDAGYRFIGSIRDPWDWYLSLWTFGCTHTGGVYQLATRPRSPIDYAGALARHPRYLLECLTAAWRRRPETWIPLFENPDNVSAFRTWLSMMHDPKFWSDYDSGYFLTPMSHYAGFYSYRFLSLFSREPRALFDDKRLEDFGHLRDFDKRTNYINYFVRCEALEADLTDALVKCGVELSADAIQRITGADPTNVSSRRKPATHYYDDSAIDLVAGRERLIIDRFGYNAQSLTSSP